MDMELLIPVGVDQNGCTYQFIFQYVIMVLEILASPYYCYYFDCY